LLMGLGAMGAQAPGGPPAPKQEPVPERDRLIRQAEELRQAGKLDEAVAAAERALELERRAGGEASPREAEALARLAELHELRGDWVEAVGRRKEALAIRVGVDGKEHWRTADARLALAFARKASGLVDEERNRVRAALRREQEAVRLEAQGKLAEAERIALEVLEVYRSVVGEEAAEAGRIWHVLGRIHIRRYDLKGARAANEQAIAIRRKALPADHPDIAMSLNNLGNVQEELRDYAAARKSHEEALALLRKSLPPDHPLIATSLNNLGNLQYELREYAAARKIHEEALAIRRKALPESHPDIAQSLNNLGLMQLELREYAAARKSHEAALAIFRKALPADHPDIAHSLFNLGMVQYELSDYAAARKNHEAALAIFRKALPADHPDIAMSLNNLGVVQEELRDYVAARKIHEEALAIRRKALPDSHPDIAQSLNNLGNVQYELRDYAAARKSLEGALAIKRKSLPPDHPGLAYPLRILGEFELESGADPQSAARSLTEVTDILLADQLRKAIAQAEQEQLASAQAVHLILHLMLGAAVRGGGDPAAVHDRVIRAKGSVTAQQRWARQLRDAADPDTRRLLDRLRQVSQQLLGLSVAEGPGLSRSAAAQDTVALIQTLSAERSQLERQLAERSPLYKAFQARARIGSAEVRAALPAGTALVDLAEYIQVTPADGQAPPLYGLHLAAFVVRPERKEVILVPLGPAQQLAALIDAWRASHGAGKKPADGQPDPGAELRKRLWEPLAAHLEGVSVVLVSPDGPLTGLPWAALPGSQPGTYLVHEYAFAIIPVPQLLPELLRGAPRSASEQPSLLLAGGIDFGEQNAPAAGARAGKLPPVPVFGPLAGTESEVNDLEKRFRRTFPQAPPPLVLGEDQATKQAILAAAPAHRFLHLATHGFFAGESEQSILLAEQRAALQRGDLRRLAGVAGRHPGLLSGLVFAGVNRSDRRPEETILTALEAAELELGQVELVVLSACNTGRGQLAGGEGVLGLQRAFQLAGARSVVASLWRVPDEETHQLMREFYRRVWSDKPVPRGEALRQAQLWMLENWKPRGGVERRAPQGPPPPYYWAAFVLSGDWR